MKKFIVSTLAAVILTAGAAVPALSAAEWTYDEATRTITITGSGALNDGNAWSDKLSSAKHIVVSDGFTSIGDNVFFSCGTVEDITLPEGITAIGSHAFALSGNLKKVTLPSTLTKLGDEVFAECTALSEVTIPKSLTAFNANVFTNCSALSAYTVDAENTAYKSDNGVLFTKDGATLIAYPPGKPETSYTIPEGTVSIGESAFNYNETLTAVTLPDSVSVIAPKAFFFCQNLNSISLGSGLKTIGESAFYGSSCASVTVPFGTETIGDNAFKNSPSLTLLDLPNSVKSIGKTITQGCSKELEIGCYGNSEAGKYAKSNGIKTKLIVRVMLNGRELEFDSPATILNDCTMVPMRKIFESLGAEVSWDAATATATGVKDGTTISFTIGDNTLIKNGTAVALEAPAQIINERTLVHVRAIAESFGAQVDWNGTDGIVNITQNN